VFPTNSLLQQSEYDALADVAMEELLDRLQDVLDSHGDSSLEVEYHVCLSSLSVCLAPPFIDCPCSTEWGHHPRSGPGWYVCDQ
jgi:hypothetical protein